MAGVTLDSAGNLYGTTVREQGRGATQALYGTVYKLSKSGQLTALYVLWRIRQEALTRV